MEKVDRPNSRFILWVFFPFSHSLTLFLFTFSTLSVLYELHWQRNKNNSLFQERSRWTFYSFIIHPFATLFATPGSLELVNHAFFHQILYLLLAVAKIRRVFPFFCLLLLFLLSIWFVCARSVVCVWWNIVYVCVCCLVQQEPEELSQHFPCRNEFFFSLLLKHLSRPLKLYIEMDCHDRMKIARKSFHIHTHTRTVGSSGIYGKCVWNCM